MEQLYSSYKILADTISKRGHLLFGDFQDPVFHPQGVQLLLLEWDTVRQRRNMPVDMPVPLLASQGKDIYTFGFQSAPDCFGKLIHCPLESQVFRKREIPGDLLLVLDGCYKDIPIQNRVFVEG